MNKERVLFICIYNSARSQMAEGILRYLASDRFEVKSAGTYPSGINPYAIKVLSEIGIDISKQKSKSVNEFLEHNFDYVITLCDQGKQSCPTFLGKYKLLHWDLQDPSQTQGTDEEKLEVFRRVRNQIKENILKFSNISR